MRIGDVFYSTDKNISYVKTTSIEFEFYIEYTNSGNRATNSVYPISLSNIEYNILKNIYEKHKSYDRYKYHD